MVHADREALDQDEEDFRRRALLLLTEIRDHNQRMREIMERLFGQQPNDPRYKQSSVYEPRLKPSEK